MKMTDYIEYYKNNTFEETKFNIIDSLIFSYLAYQPLFKLEDNKTLNELYEECTKIKKEDIYCSCAPRAISMLEIMKDSKRYENIRVYGVKKIMNKDIQFGAITFRTDDFTYVAFEGTNTSMTGWIENFLITCDYPTRTHIESINYLKEIINDNDTLIYVGGHSKGGNSAMVASMETTDDIFDRIKTIYNFDGPGFRDKEFNTTKFEKMHKKCINILPDGSMVGVLLNNKDYNFISADEISFKKHYPTNWNVFGEYLVKGEQNAASKKLQETLYTNYKTVNMEEYKILVMKTKSFFNRNDLVSSHDVQGISFDEFKKLIMEVKDVSPETKAMFFELIKNFIWR